MKIQLLSVVLLQALAISGHSIFQRLKVNGVDQGQLVAVRAPSDDNPLYDVTAADIACNTGLNTPVSTAVVTIPAGAVVSQWWEHVLGGPQTPGDPDNPIASSHKGPLMTYLAKVTDASIDTGAGLKWFKVAEEGLDTTTGKWGVDSMIAGAGWWNFTMPTCIAPGEYLLRHELIALHNAETAKEAQFYLSCAGIKVTGSGTETPTDTVSFPGAYSASDPGILINIYGNTGQPDNGRKPYTIPGPAVIKCGAAASTAAAAAAATTLVTSTVAAAAVATTEAAAAAGAALYGQCGGTGWTGATTCAEGTCTESSEYYSQCVPS